MVHFFIEQCRHPSGFIGGIMVRIWNVFLFRYAKKYMNKIEFDEKDIVLDVGCGGGRFIQFLSKHKIGQTIYGVDDSQTAIDQSIKLNRISIKNKYVYLLKEKVENLSLRSDSIDKAFAFQTHIYWDNLEQALMRLHNVLKKTGELHIICEKYKIDYHLTSYAETDQFQELLHSVGFDDVRVSESNGMVYFHCLKWGGINV